MKDMKSQAQHREMLLLLHHNCQLKRESLGSFFFKKSCSTTTGLTEIQLVEKELSCYFLLMLTLKPIHWTGGRSTPQNFPQVSNLAMRYLCIPATSSPSERVFSTGGNMVTCHRVALKPETVDRLVCLASNL